MKILCFKIESGAIGTNRHWEIQSCSAVTGEGLLPGIDWIVQDIASRIFMLE
jgi:ADP-ribosylation factor-like protein 2